MVVLFTKLQNWRQIVALVVDGSMSELMDVRGGATYSGGFPVQQFCQQNTSPMTM
ncbi:MAG: hypothetical protein AB7U29_14440 [Desulfobulbus sp.]